MADRKSNQKQPTLLSGGNPQIPKGEGPGPVRDYIAAMPGWKQAIGQRIDGLVHEEVDEVFNAVKWNQPYYGASPGAWFLSFRCYTDYVQVQFFKGTSLDPQPPKGSKHPEVRYLDIRQDEDIDEAQLRRWIAQASKLPGEEL